jgi:ubiquinone/menaquinone biosynthesis C-methylase UbiE
MQKNKINFNPSSLTNFTHFILSQIIQEGDQVVDATVGNGNDTIFLAKQVGDRGQVWGFDINQTALDITREKLNLENSIDNVKLILANHALIDQNVSSAIKACMFNLGYLPGSDFQSITNPKDTLKAINCCLKLLQKNGIITIVSYKNHNGGLSEYFVLKEFLHNLTETYYKVMEYSFTNTKKKNAPVLFIVFKK